MVVAARDLHPGLPVAEGDLYAVQVPPRFLPEGVFVSPDHVVGRIPRESILANEFVRGERLSDPEAGAGLHALIPRNMRALSVDLGDGAALAGLLEPGALVDVLVTIEPDPEDRRAEVRTLTVLQAAFVLGVNGRRAGEAPEDAARRGAGAPSVTLLLTPSQAEDVAHAANLGALRLTLRNGRDGSTPELPGVDLEDLRVHVDPRPPTVRRAPAPVKQCRTLVIVEGAESRSVLVDPAGLPCP